MTQRITRLLGCLALMALPATASATAPGNFGEFYLDQYLSVCKADTTIQCVDRLPSQSGGLGLFSGVECPGGPAANLCEPSVFPGATLRGVLTLIADDDTQDEIDAVQDDDNFTYTFFLDVASGDDRFVHAESFYSTDDVAPFPCFGNSPCIAATPWRPISSEANALAIIDIGGYVPTAGVGVLGPLRTRLEAFGQQQFGVLGVPILREFDMKPGGPSQDARTTDQATVGRFRVRIDFAKPLP